MAIHNYIRRYIVISSDISWCMAIYCQIWWYMIMYRYMLWYMKMYGDILLVYGSIGLCLVIQCDICWYMALYARWMAHITIITARRQPAASQPESANRLGFLSFLSFLSQKSLFCLSKNLVFIGVDLRNIGFTQEILSFA